MISQPRTAADLLANYNYDEAHLIIPQFNALNGTGPYLIAWKKPIDLRHPDAMGDYLVLDLSRYNKEDMVAAMILWRKIFSDVNHWHSFANAYFIAMQQFKSLLEKYGPSIYDNVHAAKK